MENFTLPDLWIALLLPLLLLGVWWTFYKELRTTDERHPRHATPDDRRHPCAVHPADIMVLPRTRRRAILSAQYRLRYGYRQAIGKLRYQRSRDKSTLVVELLRQNPDMTHEELMSTLGGVLARTGVREHERAAVSALLKQMQTWQILEKV